MKSPGKIVEQETVDSRLKECLNEIVKHDAECATSKRMKLSREESVRKSIDALSLTNRRRASRVNNIASGDSSVTLHAFLHDMGLMPSPSTSTSSWSLLSNENQKLSM